MEAKNINVDFLCLAVVHLVILVAMLPRAKHVKVINEGLWVFKLIFLAFLIFLAEILEFAWFAGHFLQLLTVWVSPVLYVLMVRVIFNCF